MLDKWVVPDIHVQADRLNSMPTGRFVMGGALRAIVGATFAVAVSLLAGQACAQATWDATGTDAGSDQWNLLVTTAGFGDQAITSISGEFDGFAVTTLSGYAGADNLLTTANVVSSTDVVYFDFGGISFYANGIEYNLGDSNFPLGQVNNSVVDPGGNGASPYDYAITSLSLTEVPEPASLVGLGVGLIALGFVRYKRA
jgi:hypothetical protein